MSDYKEALVTLQRQADSMENIHLYMMQLNTLIQTLLEQSVKMAREIVALDERVKMLEHSSSQR